MTANYIIDNELQRLKKMKNLKIENIKLKQEIKELNRLVLSQANALIERNTKLSKIQNKSKCV